MERREKVARMAAGVPWKREMKQLEASGRSLEVQFLKTSKYATKYSKRKKVKKINNGGIGCTQISTFLNSKGLPIN